MIKIVKIIVTVLIVFILLNVNEKYILFFYFILTSRINMPG